MPRRSGERAGVPTRRIIRSKSRCTRVARKACPKAAWAGNAPKISGARRRAERRATIGCKPSRPTATSALRAVLRGFGTCRAAGGSLQSSKVLQIEALAIGGVDLFECQLPASSPHREQPRRAFEQTLGGLGIEDAAPEQIEGARLHGTIAIPSHQQVAPALYLDAQATPFLGPVLPFDALRRCAQCPGVSASLNGWPYQVG